MKEILLLLYTSVFTYEKPPKLLEIENRLNKNHIEFGNSYVALINYMGTDLTRFKPGLPSYFSYTRNVLPKYSIGINYQYFYQDTLYFTDLDIGKNITTSYNLIGLNFGRRIKDGNVLLLIKGELSYKWGDGHTVLTKFKQGTLGPDSIHTLPDEIVKSRSGFSSLGIGFSTELNYILLNRISLGASASYSYFFETSGLSNNKLLIVSNSNVGTHYYDYQPNRQMFIIHLKMGVLF